MPHDHFYRHLEKTLNLSFVREFVHETEIYACGGRPSIDPIEFFKLQLVMFFGAPFYVVRHFCTADKDGRGDPLVVPPAVETLKTHRRQRPHLSSVKNRSSFWE